MIPNYLNLYKYDDINFFYKKEITKMNHLKVISYYYVIEQNDIAI